MSFSQESNKLAVCLRPKSSNQANLFIKLFNTISDIVDNYKPSILLDTVYYIERINSGLIEINICGERIILNNLNIWYEIYLDHIIISKYKDKIDKFLLDNNKKIILSVDTSPLIYKNMIIVDITNHQKLYELER